MFSRSLNGSIGFEAELDLVVKSWPVRPKPSDLRRIQDFSIFLKYLTIVTIMGIMTNLIFISLGKMNINESWKLFETKSQSQVWLEMINKEKGSYLGSQVWSEVQAQRASGKRSLGRRAPSRSHRGHCRQARWGLNCDHWEVFLKEFKAISHCLSDICAYLW